MQEYNEQYYGQKHDEKSKVALSRRIRPNIKV